MKDIRFRYVTIVLVATVFAISGFTYSSDVFFQIKKNFTIFSEVYQEVSTRYVDDVDPEKLMRRGISSMLELLDPYTVLIDEADQQNFEILTTGRYAGVGIEVGARNGRLVIIAPIEGYSAHKRGVRAGDIILEVNGFSVESMSVDDLQSLVAGEPGTLLILTVERYGFDQPIEFELIRENVEIRNITFSGYVNAERGVGYVSLARFGQQAALELRQAIATMKEEGELRSLILDLRNNPGGLLDEAVKIVDLFVGPGIEVVRTQGRSFESTFTSRTELPAFFTGELIVLQNNGSASASEIVSGALQDLDRAVIVGERSFGKGLVQVVRPLSYNVALKITTSRYYIPSGRSIQSVVYPHDDGQISYQVPDSLRNAFRTRAGRTVYDGVGIDPDVVLDRQAQSLVEIALLQNSAYFFFANEYRAQYPTFNSDGLPSQAYDAFMQYLSRTSFDYTTRSQRFLMQLEEQLSGDEASVAQAPLQELKLVIDQQKAQELENSRERVSRELFLELISRYEGPTGRIQASLQSDPGIQRSMNLLSTNGEIRAILQSGN